MSESLSIGNHGPSSLLHYSNTTFYDWVTLCDIRWHQVVIVYSILSLWTISS